MKQSDLILEATDTVAVRTVVAAHEGAAAEEAQVAGVAANDRTVPVVAAAACAAEQAIDVIAVTGHNKFQG